MSINTLATQFEAKYKMASYNEDSERIKWMNRGAAIGSWDNIKNILLVLGEDNEKVVSAAKFILKDLYIKFKLNNAKNGEEFLDILESMKDEIIKENDIGDDYDFNNELFLSRFYSLVDGLSEKADLETLNAYFNKQYKKASLPMDKYVKELVGDDDEAAEAYGYLLTTGIELYSTSADLGETFVRDLLESAKRVKDTVDDPIRLEQDVDDLVIDIQNNSY